MLAAVGKAEASNHARTRRRIVERLRYTMEDFTKWKVRDVQQWLREVATGSHVLTAELGRNSDAFRTTAGATLNKMTEEWLAGLEISYNSRSILVACIDDLQKNEQQNVPRRKKAAKLLDAFRNSDADNSGTIEAEEIRDIVRATFPETSDLILKVYYDVLLRECDKAGTGMIILQELLDGDAQAIMEKIMAEAEQAEIIEANFHLMDVDNSGELDADELRALIAQSFPDAGPTKQALYLRKILLDLDRNNNGLITLDAFLSSEHLSLLRQEAPSGGKGRDQRCAPLSPKRVGGAEIGISSAGGRSLGAGVEVICNTGDGKIMMEKAEEMLEGNIDGWEEATDMFMAAASSSSSDAPTIASALQRAADCRIKMRQPLQAAETLRQAADHFCAGHQWEDAIDCLKEGNEIYQQEGRPRLAGKLCAQISDIHREGLSDVAGSIDWLLTSSAFFDPRTDLSEFVSTLKRTLPLYIDLQMYAEARVVAGRIADAVSADQRNKIPAVGSGVEWDMRGLCILLELANLDTSSSSLRQRGIAAAQEALAHHDASALLKSPMHTALVRAVGVGNADEVEDIIKTCTEGKEPEEHIRNLLTAIIENARNAVPRETHKRRATPAMPVDSHVRLSRAKVSRHTVHPALLGSA